MALPKKKKSVSEKKKRQNSVKLNQTVYTRCNNCLEFINIHRSCLSNNCEQLSSNIEKKYDLNNL